MPGFWITLEVHKNIIFKIFTFIHLQDGMSIDEVYIDMDNEVPVIFLGSVWVCGAPSPHSSPDVLSHVTQPRHNITTS